MDNNPGQDSPYKGINNT